MPGLVLPASFGRYTLLELVGGGGMASVYRAALSGAGGFEKELAVKVVRPELAIEPQFVEMFLDEARLSARLGHANLVHTFDFGQVEGTWFLAMEFVQGPTLAKLLRIARARGVPLGAARTMHLGCEVARGLGYAHRLRDEAGVVLGLVHRDVSPQNILLSREGEVKLADFGIAKAASRSTVTRTGHVRGKCAYMAPEQARGETIDARTDVFALGVVLWECLAGQPLFDGASDGAVLLQVVQREIPPPSRFCQEVPAALDDLVLRMLARDPGLRPANGDEVAHELAELKLRLVRSTQETDLAAYQRELGSGTAVLNAVGQGGGAGRHRSEEAVELESAAILEAESLVDFDAGAATRLPLRAGSGSSEVTRISRPATGSGERAAVEQRSRTAGTGVDAPEPIRAETRGPRRVRAGVRVALVAGGLLAAAGAWGLTRAPGEAEERAAIEPARAALDQPSPAPFPDDMAPAEDMAPAGAERSTALADHAASPDGTAPVGAEETEGETFVPPLLDLSGDDEGVPPLLAALPPDPSDDGTAAEEDGVDAGHEALPGTGVVLSGETASATVASIASPAGQGGVVRRPQTRDRANARLAVATSETVVAPAAGAGATPLGAPADRAAPPVDPPPAGGKTGLLVLSSTHEGLVVAALNGREIVRMGPRSPKKFEVPVGRHVVAFRSGSHLDCSVHADITAGAKTSLAVNATKVVEIVEGTALPRDCIEN